MDGYSQVDNCYRWDEPDSKLTVLLHSETVESLQMSVRGGGSPRSFMTNEVGGILLGKRESSQDRTLIIVDGFEPVNCEHLAGASYVLGRQDAALFEAAITSVNSQAAVGYYRSHNRKGLFLSPDDLILIQRHFRDPETVFMVIKPLPNGACTAGFFFWKDGLIQADFTDSEVPLIPLAAPSTGCDLIDTTTLPAAVESRSAATPFVRAGARKIGPRRIGGFGLVGLALAATTAVLTQRTPRNAATVAPRTSALVAPSALPKPVPQSASISPDPAKFKAVLRPKRSVTAPAQKPRIDKHPANNKRFVLPLSPSLTAPPERSLNPAPPVAPAAPIVPPTLSIPEPVMEKPAAPSTAAPVTSTVNPPVATPPAPKVLRTSSNPRVIHSVAPAVPRGIGLKVTSDVEVEVEVTINAKGKVTAARIASTRGAAAELLTIEALKAAQLFRFQPAEENGRAVAGATVLTFHFAQNTR